MDQQKFSPLAASRSVLPNLFDIIAVCLVLGVIGALAFGARDANVPLEQLNIAQISLDPSYLPEYALRTTLRMLAAIIFSTLFTLVYATIAAKSRRAEIVLVPILDVLQSVPILGFLTFTVVFFLGLFPGRVLGAECAAVFAIFTSQAWNMTFSMYQSLRTVPKDLDEATQSFRLPAFQRFWKLDVPFALPGLVWNAMMSMSGGWFFVVAAEAITVGDTTIALPGVGAYVALAIKEKNLAAVGYAVIAMLVVILIYDQLLFRPIVAWADKFRVELVASSSAPSSWVLDLFRKTSFLRLLIRSISLLLRNLASIRLPKWSGRVASYRTPERLSRVIDIVWLVFIIALAAYCADRVFEYVSSGVGLGDVYTVFLLGLTTLARVVVLMIIATLIWVPIGVWIGLRPKIAEKIQPLAQFLAAFPANIAFPVFVVLIVRYGGDPNIWLSPLMILGTQWYILFNVIAGASAFPTDLREAAGSFHVRGWNWWFKVILPGVLPYYITGAITAAGGSWNAAIVAEVASWGDTKLTAFGLGSYIAEATDKGDFPRVVLGVTVMSLFVILLNRLLWRPLYAFAERRVRLD